VGLEIHVELATRSKMFTGAPNVAHPDHFDAEPNTLCDPVVLGLPGVLPVMNKAALWRRLASDQFTTPIIRAWPRMASGPLV